MARIEWNIIGIEYNWNIDCKTRGQIKMEVM